MFQTCWNVQEWTVEIGAYQLPWCNCSLVQRWKCYAAVNHSPINTAVALFITTAQYFSSHLQNVPKTAACRTPLSIFDRNASTSRIEVWKRYGNNPPGYKSIKCQTKAASHRQICLRTPSTRKAATFQNGSRSRSPQAATRQNTAEKL